MMTKSLNLSRSVLIVAVALASGSAAAYQAGDIVVRGGLAKVSPDDDSSLVSLDGADLAGTSVSVDSETQIGISASYLVTNKIGIELLAATPFTHTVTGHGAPIDGLEIADVKHLPPTLSVQYFPLGSDSAWQPYVGAGINYTIFFDEDLSSDIVGLLGEGDIELDDSIGLAFELGCDYAINDQWVVNAAVWNIDLETTATIDLDSGSVVEVDVDIDPWVYMLSVGYQF